MKPRKNISPWLHQLDQSREYETLQEDISADVVIVGAGIAGISTAFYALEAGRRRVVVLERHKLAHGATGHNAGQLVGHFERGLKSLVEEFGLEKAIEGQDSIEKAWDILQHMYTEAGIDIPFFKFQGHTGLVSKEQILIRLENNRLRVLGGLEAEEIVIFENADFLEEIPSEYQGLYSRVSRQEIQRLLETERSDFLAVLSYQKGVINSALFCQEIVRYLKREYPERFTLYEHTPVHKIVLHDTYALIDTQTHTVEAKHVVLCTNGFENIRIFNESGLDIDTKYHYLVSGVTGYMSGYLEKPNKSPMAISYFTDPSTDPANSYFYLTRRPYEYEKGIRHNLISIGGPDTFIEDTTPYSSDEEYPEEHAETIDRFVRSTYDTDPNKTIEYIFTWHGLMGYTRNRVRMIGPEPKNKVLLYNLGCNGIGILPSVYGAWKLAKYLRGDPMKASIFDVPTEPDRNGRDTKSILQ
jgi:glycine/D-amino acid oxidase-like deaminating enzyme